MLAMTKQSRASTLFHSLMEHIGLVDQPLTLAAFVVSWWYDRAENSCNHDPEITGAASGHTSLASKDSAGFC